MPPSSSEAGCSHIGWVGARRVVLLDSISYLGPGDADQVVISGSHGGDAAGRYVLANPPWLVILNDAGVGKDRAGISALQMCQEAGIAAAAVSHTSARIGDASDTWSSGVIAHLNREAHRLGLWKGAAVHEAVGSLEGGASGRIDGGVP